MIFLKFYDPMFYERDLGIAVPDLSMKYWFCSCVFVAVRRFMDLILYEIKDLVKMVENCRR